MIQELLNNLGILDAHQQQQLAAEVASLRTSNRLLRAQLSKLTAGHIAIVDHERQMTPGKTQAQLMEWSAPYALAMTALGANQGRREAANAISLSFGNDPKQRTGQKASAAQKAVANRKSPIHINKHIRRQAESVSS